MQAANVQSGSWYPTQIDGNFTPTTGISVTGPIYLLVGKRERVPPVRSDFAPDDDKASWKCWSPPGWYDPRNPETWRPPGWVNSPATDAMYWRNCQDLKNLWVTVNQQTGLVTTAEMAVVSSTLTTTQQQLNDSRSFARTAQSMGGQ